VADFDGNACVVYLAATAILGVSPADGKTVWKYTYTALPFQRLDEADIAATPVLWKNRIVAGYHVRHQDRLSMTVCVEVRNGEPKLAWTTGTEFSTCWHSFVGFGGFVYGETQRGDRRFCCYDIRTGKCRWRTKKWAPAVPFIIAGGKMISYCKNRLTVAEISPTGYKALVTANVGKRVHWVVPVLSNGRLYLRSRDGALMCLDVRKK